MKYTLYLFKLILIEYVLQIKCTHIDKNNTDVFITYAGHSDVDRPISKPISIPLSKLETVTEIPITEDKEEPVKADTQFYDDVTEGIVFIPNDKPVFRNEDVYSDGLKLGDVIESRRIGGLMQGEKIHITETESPKTDILFVSGKNNENIEKPAQIVKQEKQDSTRVRKTKVSKNKLHCNNLHCNNTVKSVCGGKEENKQMKYRLFLNECFFRKVNCGFQHAANRYDIVPMENCKNVGAHYPTRPYMFKPVSPPAQKIEVPANARRSLSSRRSLNMGVDGSVCGHACPASCTEDYDPQCAMSSSGRIKVFLNHCKLDHNSCLHKVAWHKLPLSQCVGGKKADMTQNRRFIAWMQRVGVVDGRGRLVMA